MLSLSILWLSCCGRVAFCISQKMKAGILLQRQFCDVSSPSPPPPISHPQKKQKNRRKGSEGDARPRSYSRDGVSVNEYGNEAT
jgi:hypothetical protein